MSARIADAKADAIAPILDFPGATSSLIPRVGPSISSDEVSPFLQVLEEGYLQAALRIAERAGFNRDSLRSLPASTDERLALPLLNGHRTEPIHLLVESEGEVVAVESEELGLTGFGKNYYEAIEDLAEQLELVARDYLYAPDERLTPSGQEKKARLARVVKPLDAPH